MSIAERIERLRQEAHAGPIGKRHSSFRLYEVLADCMDIALRCRRDPADRAELDRLVREQPKRGKGRWTLRSSDEFIAVCRYVFPNGSRSAERSNSSRYAHCLRQAAERQIAPADLVHFLKTEGGLNVLYLARPLTRTTVSAKTIRFDRAVELPKDGEFTLTLKRQADGSFEVIEVGESTRERQAYPLAG